MKLKQIILTISIALILVFFVAYGINTFYKAPKYEDFCEERATPIDTEEECEEAGGRWEVYTNAPRPSDREGWCEQDYTCSKEYEAAIPIG